MVRAKAGALPLADRKSPGTGLGQALACRGLVRRRGQQARSGGDAPTSDRVTRTDPPGVSEPRAPHLQDEGYSQQCLPRALVRIR